MFCFFLFFSSQKLCHADADNKANADTDIYKWPVYFNNAIIESKVATIRTWIYQSKKINGTCMSVLHNTSNEKSVAYLQFNSSFGELLQTPENI